jgi:hypothetical protein
MDTATKTPYGADVFLGEKFIVKGFGAPVVCLVAKLLK